MSERTTADRVVSAIGGTVTVFLLLVGGLLYWASMRQEGEGLAYGWSVLFLVAAVFTAILSAAVARACRHR